MESSPAVLKEIAAAIAQKADERRPAYGPYLLAIDGRCGAGKTTLASLLKPMLGGDVVHMDHFFLPACLRGEERLALPGGNAHYERVLEEVILPAHRGGGFSYRPYDCRQNLFGDKICVKGNPVLIIEGSYACHPALRPYYNLTVFLSVSAETQLIRLRQREGVSGLQGFIDKWIPLEERYFAGCLIRENCDMIFDL